MAGAGSGDILWKATGTGRHSKRKLSGPQPAVTSRATFENDLGQSQMGLAAKIDPAVIMGFKETLCDPSGDLISSASIEKETRR